MVGPFGMRDAGEGVFGGEDADGGDLGGVQELEGKLFDGPLDAAEVRAEVGGEEQDAEGRVGSLGQSGLTCRGDDDGRV